MLVSALSVVDAAASTYYVDKTKTSANNSNPGIDPNLPWLTLAKAGTTLVAGDTVIVGAGGSYDEAVTFTNSGAAGNPITITAAPGARPKVRRFDLSNKSYVTVSGFEITNIGFTADLNPSIYLRGTKGVRVINNYIHDTTTNTAGIRVAGTKAFNLYLSGNTLNGIGPAGNRAVGMELWGDNILSENNDISHTQDFTRVYGSRNVIRNDVWHDTPSTEQPNAHIDGMQSFCSNGIPNEAANYLLIEGVDYHDNLGSDEHFALINSTSACGGSTTVILRENKLRGVGEATYISDTNQSFGSFHKIYNNTVVNAPAGGPNTTITLTLSGITGGSVLNNIFVDAITNATPRNVYTLKSLDPTSQGNRNLAFFSSGAVTWNSPIGTETNSRLNQNPLFSSASDFHLLAGSPAQDTGGALTAVATADTGSGTTLVVTDSHFFQDGWGGAQPDWIAVGTTGNVAQISSIDYATNTITLASPITRADGQSVWLYKNSTGLRVLYGTAPDLGAFEIGDASVPVAGNSGLITSSSVTSSGLVLNWTKAIDDASAQSMLQYEVRVSSSNNLATVPNAEANGTVVQAYTADIATANVTGLDASTTYFFNVIVRDQSGNKSIYVTKSVTTTAGSSTPPVLDSIAPNPGNSGIIAASGITGTTLTLNWTPATDDVTAQTSLLYEVRRSSSDNIDTVIDAETNGTIIRAYAANISTLSVTGLTPAKSYFFNVIVKDAAGNKETYATKNATTLDTTPPVPGSTGTITGASIGLTSLTLNWAKAIDNVTPQASLLYEVRRSLLNNVGSIVNAEANGTVIRSYVNDLATLNVTGLLPKTLYFFAVIVKDAAGNKALYSTGQLTTLVSTGPSISMLTPAAGAIVAGTVAPSATAIDDVGVVGVQFLLNGNVLGPEVLVAPFVSKWDTTQVPDGSYTLSARARDGSGNKTTSSAISIKVVNEPTPYTIPANGAMVFQSLDDSDPSVTVSHAKVLPAAGGNVGGIALIAENDYNSIQAAQALLIAEAGVPASPEVQDGMIFVDIQGNTNTGIALANENSTDAVISFYYTDATGTAFGQGSLTLAPKHQLAAFLNSPPFNAPNTVLGTFTFSSSVPVGAIALRGVTNERGDFLFSTLPVLRIGVATTMLPLFAQGDGWNTQLILTNSSATQQTGTVRFFGQGTSKQAAAALTLVANGVSASTFSYSIPPHSMYRLTTGGTAASVGSVRITPAGANPPSSSIPSAFAILGFENAAGVTVSEATVEPLQTGTAFRLYVESFGTTNTDEIMSGVTIANGSSSSNVVHLELTRLDGSVAKGVQTVTLAGNGQVSKFLDELFHGLPSTFQGILRVTSTAPIAVAELRGRYNSRGDFLISTMPVLNEATPPLTSLVFPHIVSGGGYSTQIILFGKSSQSSTGQVMFAAQDGTNLPAATTTTP